MPTGVYKHKPISEETKLKMSLASIGKQKSEGHRKKISMAKLGKKQSKETIEKRKKSLKGVVRTKEWREKIGNSNRGKKRTEEQKKNLSLCQKGSKHSIEARVKKSKIMSGDKSHFWKGGITPINKKIRKSIEYKLWREAVFKRDNWTCIWCGFKGYVEADHIKPFALYPELRFSIDNGRTLCKECHLSTNTYGGRTKTI